MTTPLTAAQGRALVHLLATMRRDWQPAGIETAVRKAADGADGLEVCVAAVRAAANPEVRTPGLIPSPGPHWQGTRAGSRQAPIDCHLHPGQPSGRCQTCRDEASPPPPGWRDHLPSRRGRVGRA